MDKSKISGIYGWFNRTNGKCYVGSSVHLLKRRYEHLRQIRKGISGCTALQSAFNKYGEAVFAWCIIELVSDVQQLVIREQHWIEALDSYRKGYNASPQAASVLGIKRSLATREKVRQANLGKKPSPENVERLRTMGIGRKLSDEEKRKCSEGIKAAFQRPEVIANLAHRDAKRRGFVMSDEQKEKLREKAIGRKHSAETRTKMSEMRKGRKLNRTAQGIANAQRGESRHNAKLTEQKVLDIRVQFAQGATKRQIATEFEVSWAVIHAVVIGKTWKHVTGGINLSG